MNNWPTKKLGKICKINPTKSEIKDISNDELVSFVQMSSVSEVTQEIEEQVEKTLGEVRKSYTYFRKGDVIFAKITPCMENGKVALTDNLEHEIGFGSTEFHVVRADIGVLPEYVFYLLASEDFKKEAETKMTGSAGQKRVPKSFLQKYEIPLPPFEEQKRIVKVLEEKLGKVKKMIRLREEAIADTENLLSARLYETFEEGIKQGWEERKLKELGKLQTGTTPKTSIKKFYGDFIPFIKPADVDYRNDGKINYENNFLSKEGLEIGRVTDEGSTAMVCIGASIGKVGFSDRKISFNQQINVISPKEGINKKFIFYTLRDKGFYKKVIGASSQSTLPIINKTKWGNLTILLPNLKTQEKIVEELDELSEKVNQLKELEQSQLTDLKNLEQAFLREAFEGKLI
ncbi:MAG: restriction endonuclease subunit S [Candidatus Paceibacterota bacterium]